MKFISSFCRNRKRSEINQMELKLLQKKLGENEAVSSEGDVNSEAQDPSLVDDTTRLLEEDEAEEPSPLSTENVVISNPIVSMEDSNESHVNGHVRTSALSTSSSDVNGTPTDVGGEVEVHSVSVERTRSQSTVEVVRQSKWRSLQFKVKKSLRNFLVDVVFFMR